MKIPTLSVQKARELDKRARDEFRIPSILLMETAAIGLVNHVRNILKGYPNITQVLILCGGGSNSNILY